MTTGYEAHMYRDIGRIANAAGRLANGEDGLLPVLERIATALEQIAAQGVSPREVLRESSREQLKQRWMRERGYSEEEALAMAQQNLLPMMTVISTGTLVEHPAEGWHGVVVEIDGDDLVIEEVDCETRRHPVAKANELEVVDA